jgi:acyl-CoA hydrolase
MRIRFIAPRMTQRQVLVATRRRTVEMDGKAATQINASDAGVTVVSEMVFPTQTNHYGTLFGGEALKLMGKAAFIAASRNVRKPVVMASADRTAFHEPVRQGDLAEVLGRVVHGGRTSLTVETELFSENLLTGERRLCSVARFIMVVVDHDGRPIARVPERPNDETEGAP